MEIKLLQELCEYKKIKWSVHAAARIQERGISRNDIISCIKKGEIIEDYPTDFPHPSCLIFGYAVDNKVIHVVAGCDGEYIYIITAYYPNTVKFENDLKTRRRD